MFIIKGDPRTILTGAILLLGFISLLIYGFYNQSAIDLDNISSFILDTEDVYSSGQNGINYIHLPLFI